MVENTKELLENYSPMLMHDTYTGVLFAANKLSIKRMQAQVSALEAVNKNFETLKRRWTPNNKLKRNGQPMKRKGRRRTKRRAWYEL